MTYQLIAWIRVYCPEQVTFYRREHSSPMVKKKEQEKQDENRD